MSKAQLTQKKILKAARTLFLLHGFSGASMSELAKTAGVNKALIFHYFESKEKLWNRVKQDIVGQAALEQLSHPPTHSFLVFLEHIIAARFELYAHNPDLVTMMLWQRLDARADLSDASIALSLWKSELQDFQKHGAIAPHVSLNNLRMLILSLTALPFMEKWSWTSDVDVMDVYRRTVVQAVQTMAQG